MYLVPSRSSGSTLLLWLKRSTHSKMRNLGLHSNVIARMYFNRPSRDPPDLPSSALSVLGVVLKGEMSLHTIPQNSAST